MADKECGWIEFSITLLLWILEIRLAFSVICQDCPEPCQIPGVCVTRGRCFVRRDVNGRFYRGCADKERWKDLDISENGCSLQEYLGWNQTKALWCLCDKPFCNRKGVQGFKNGAYFLSAFKTKHSGLNKLSSIHDFKIKQGTSDNNNANVSSPENNQPKQSNTAVAIENNINHNAHIYGGKVDVVDEKRGLDENIIDQPAIHTGFIFNPIKAYSRPSVRPVLQTAATPVISSSTVKKLSIERVRSNWRQNHMITHHVTAERTTPMSFAQTSGSKFMKPETAGVTPLSADTARKNTAYKTASVTMPGGVQPVFETTPFMMLDIKKIISRQGIGHPNDGYKSINKEDLSVKETVKTDQHRTSNISTISSSMNLTGVTNEKTYIKTNTSNKSFGINSELSTTKLTNEDQPQIWPQGYRAVAQGEKSGEYTEVYLKLDQHVKQANLYSKDQVGLNEENGILDQRGHADIVEQVGQVTDEVGKPSSNQRFGGIVTTAAVKDSIREVISRVSGQTYDKVRNKKDKPVASTAVRNKKHINPFTERTPAATDVFQMSENMEDKSSIESMDNMDDFGLPLDVSGFVSSDFGKVEEVTACGDIFKGQSKSFPSQCPPSYTYVPRFKSCYLFTDSPANYTEAQLHCKGHHSRSRLVTIETLSEYNCLSEWLEHFPVLLDGWQGWWTGGVYHSRSKQFRWRSSPDVSHAIDQSDERWMSSLVVRPYDKTCVWLVPLSLFSLGNYWCEEESGYICEMTV